MVHFNTLAANSSPASSARISIVDAKVDTQDYVQWLLSRGYEVEVVSDRLAALDAVQRYLPDLVLIDVMMLGLDSLELLRSLRNNPATQSIPLIVLSARTAEELQIEGLEAEADDYLLKPFSARELLARVRTNLELARLRRETVRYQEQLRVEAQAAQTQVSNILESITDAFVAFDREWRYTYVNEYATQLLRKKREQLLGKNVWTEVFPELVGTESYWEYHRAIAEQVPVVFEKFSQPIGRWIEVNAYPSPDGLAVYFRDITHRKQAEQALRESEERFRQLAENLDTVFFMSEDFSEASPGRIAYVSPAYERIWGRSCESLYQNTRSWFEAVHPDDRERVQQALPGMARAQFNLEFRIVRPDGEICWVRDRVFPIYNEQGEIYRTTGIVEDITKRKQIEAALQQREAELRLITDSVPVLISFVDTEQRYRFNNRTYETWFGHPASEVYGKHLRDVLGEAAYQVLLPYVEQVLAGQPVTFESEIPYKDGGIRYVSVTYVPQFDRQGNVEGFVALVSDISDRKQAELEIQKFVSLADNSSEFIGMCDMNFVPFYVNEAGRQMVGLDDTRQYSETPVREFFFPEDQDFIVNDFFPRVLREGRAEVEIRFRHFETGEALWMIYNVFYIRGENDQQIALASVSRNITDRKLAEVALRESEFRFRNIADHSPIMIWMSAPDGAGTWFNQQWCEFTGQTLEEALGSGWLAAVHPEDARSIETICLQAHQRHEPVRLEYRLRRQDGEYRWVFDCAIARFDDTGVYLGYIGSIIDITDRKQAQQELQQTLQTLSTLIKASPLPIIVIEPNMTVKLWNPAAEQLFGWSEAEVLGQPLPIVPQEKRDECRQVREAVAKGEVFAGVETYRCKRDGATVMVSISAAALHNEQGSLNAILLIFQDITERQQAEQALRQSEERYRYLAESIPQLVWTANAKGVLLDVNQRWLDYTGLTLEQAQIEGWQAIVHPDDLPMLSQHWAAAQQHGSYYQAEGRMRRVDGVYRWYLHQAVPLKNERGQVIKWFGTATDIEDQKQLEQQRDRILQREQAAREEAERANRIKDEFLAVLSHELRSPLNPILGWAKLLQTRTFDEQKTKHALATIERNALLQTQLIEDLLDVSRILRGKLVLNAAPVNLASTIEAALETVRLAVEAKDIQIQQLLDPNVGQVMGESARLQQVIWNLLSNAVKFTPSGGTIEIRLEQIHTNAQIQVKDTGKGINPQFLPHVFEYFRQEDGTTTRKFGGLGLGLAIVRHLVELHGGTVWAESPGEGLGATFTVRLPLMPVSTQTPQDNPPAIPVTHLTGLRILVVDDQPDIQDIVAFILEQAGAAVSVATSAPEALHLMEQFLPDVLICDIGMPNMDGYMLMRQIRKLPPPQGGKLPAIALTAYAGEVDQQQAIAAGFQMHIPKPVEPDRLVRTIARLVQHPRST